MPHVRRRVCSNVSPVHLLLAGVTLVPLVGCFDETVEVDTYKTPTPSPLAGNVFDVNGLFARKNVLSQYVQNAFNDERYDQQTITTYSLVTMREGTSEEKVVYGERDCLTVLTEVSGSTTSLDQGYYDNTPYVEYVATVSPGPVIGATFDLSEQVEVKGCILEDEWNDPLPTSPDAENVYDFDMDGNPGFTIYVDGLINGTLWAVERYIFALDGTIDGKDDLSGLVYPTLEDSLLASSSTLIPTDTNTYIDDTPGANFYLLTRVADEMTCPELLDAVEMLFPTE